ncbi:MAG: DUF3187 family protein [Gammaproteobacteria bacterium]
MLLLGISVAAVPSQAEQTSPFRTRNLSPLVSIFGIPAWEAPSADERLRAGVTMELANHYRLSQRGDEILALDGETWRTGLWFRLAVAERWTVAAELPFVRQSGGVLDDVIDAWHSAFNLPDGGRNRRAEGELTFLLAEGGAPFYSLRQSTGGLGDLLVSVGRALGPSGGTRLNATVKLPTGDESVLGGSGSTDIAFTLLYAADTSVGRLPAGYFVGIGGMWLGEPDYIRYDARRTSVLGIVGGSLKAWPRTGLKAQIELHGALYDSPLRELGEPGVQLTLGGWREIGRRAIVEFGVNEDLAVSTSPDVVLHVNLSWKIPR